MRATVNAGGRRRAGPEVGLTVVFQVHLRNGNRGRRRLQVGEDPSPPVAEPARIPRVSKLVALAIKIEGLVRSGAVADLAEVARLGRVSRARMSQLADLTLLAPDVIEELLHLPPTLMGRDPITERHIRPIAAVLDWRRQRAMWKELKDSLMQPGQ